MIAADTTVIRDYVPSDFEAVKALHEANEIDYKMPNLNSPLFIVTKVAEVDGIIRAVCGCYLQAELYLWLDKSDWTDPQEKLDLIHELDRPVMYALFWDKGIDQAVLFLPPGMESFEKRLKKLGFTPDRDGWHSWSKSTQIEEQSKCV